MREISELIINGDIVVNEDVQWYDWFGWDCTSPKKVRDAIDNNPKGETIDVIINSGGGDVFAGQEIYGMLHGRDDVTINVQSIAGSAASVIAMAGKSKMSPVAMLMIHNVFMSGACGDYHDMQKNAEILKQMNAALAASYVLKTGKTEDEILKLMDRETWITANQALEYGFIDEIEGAEVSFGNAVGRMRLTDELRNKAMAEKKAAEDKEKIKTELLDDLDLYGI